MDAATTILMILGVSLIVIGLVALVKYLNLLGDTKSVILGEK